MIKKCLKFLFSRMMLVIVLLAVQFAFMMYSIWWSGKYSVYAYWTLTIISAAVVLYILNRQGQPRLQAGLDYFNFIFLCLEACATFCSAARAPPGFSAKSWTSS